MHRSLRSRQLALGWLAATIVGVVAARGYGSAEVVASRTPGRIEVTVLDGDGRPVDARLRLIPIGPSVGPAFGLGPRERTVLAVGGSARLEVPSGSYRVLAGRGPEHTRAEDSLEVRTGETRRVRLHVRRAFDPGPYRAFDLHVHTGASEDGRVSLEERLDSIRAEALEGVAITDHNRTLAVPARPEGGPMMLPGVEVTSWAPEVGHFNVFPTDEAFEHRGIVPASFFDEVHARPRRLVQVNHPRLLDHIAYFEHAGLAPDGSTREGFGLGFDLLEVWNGYDLGQPDALRSVFREWLHLVALGHGITATGNSDSHDLDRTPVGLPRTYVEVGSNPDPETLVRALQRGRAFVTTGQFLEASVSGIRPGGTARIPEDGKLAVRVRIHAAPHVSVDHVEIWLDERRALSMRIPSSVAALRLDRTFELDARGARSLVVTTRGDEPMRHLLPGRDVIPMAFTNPIHLGPAAPSPPVFHASRR